MNAAWHRRRAKSELRSMLAAGGRFTTSRHTHHLTLRDLYDLGYNVKIVWDEDNGPAPSPPSP